MLGSSQKALGREGSIPHRRIAAQKVSGEDNSIPPTCAQGWQLENHHGQPMVQVHVEPSLSTASAQIRLGGGDELDLDGQTVFARSAVMDDARHEPLARARFPTEHEGGDVRIANAVEC